MGCSGQAGTRPRGSIREKAERQRPRVRPSPQNLQSTHRTVRQIGGVSRSPFHRRRNRRGAGPPSGTVFHWRSIHPGDRYGRSALAMSDCHSASLALRRTSAAAFSKTCSVRPPRPTQHRAPSTTTARAPSPSRTGGSQARRPRRHSAPTSAGSVVARTSGAEVASRPPTRPSTAPGHRLCATRPATNHPRRTWPPSPSSQDLIQPGKTTRDLSIR